MADDHPTLPDSPIPAHLNAALRGRYRVLHRVGEGGMATVFLAEDLKHDRRVAIKVMNPGQLSAVAPERFLREISIAAKLNHPHILPVYDSGQVEDLLYYVMPLVEGETLRTRLARDKQLPIEEAIEIIQHVASGLAFAHSRGVIHRDVKPENILLHSGQAVIADFGIARAITATGEATVTRAGSIVGTPQYMSPEQVAGDELDARSDIYALACVLYELLAGRAPHVAAGAQAIFTQKLSGQAPPSLSDLRATVSPALDAAIARALATSPADRPATCDEWVAQLKGTLSHSGPRIAFRLPNRRTLRRVALGLAALVAIAAAIGIWRVVRPLAATGNAIAVFPFRPSGTGAEAWSEAVADLLATALDGTPGIVVADPWTLWRTLRADRSAAALSPEPAEAVRLAGAAGAGRIILGTVVRTGDRLTLTARVYRDGAETAGTSVTVSGVEDSLSRLVEQLAVGLIGQVWDGDAPPALRRVESYTTRSPQALNAYLRAREAMRRGGVDSAEADIDRALALDSTFALALVDGIIIKSWAQFMRGQQFFGLMALAERAVALADSMSERNALRARALLASVRTDGVGAAAAARRIIQIDSTDLEAWRTLAYYDLVYGWQYGATAADAMAAAERAVVLDPTYAPAVVFRATLAARMGPAADQREQIARLERTDTTMPLVRGALTAIRAVSASDSAFTRIAGGLAHQPPAEWFPTYRLLREQQPRRAEALLRVIEQAAPPGAAVFQTRAERLRLDIARGRSRQVDSALRAGLFTDAPAYARIVQRQLVAAELAGVGDAAAARRGVDSLGANTPPDSALVHFNQRPVWQNGWVIGAWHATGGDTVVAWRWRDVMATLPGEPVNDYRRAIQRDFDARLAARRGDQAAALVAASDAFAEWGIHTENSPEVNPEPAMRLHMALLLRAEGRTDSAAALLRSLVPPTTWMGFLTARAAFELATVAEDAGRFTEATRYFQMALDLWRDGDASIADWRRLAEEGLARVGRRAG